MFTEHSYNSYNIHLSKMQGVACSAGPNPDGAGALRRALSRTTIVPRDVIPPDDEGPPGDAGAGVASASCNDPAAGAPANTQQPSAALPEPQSQQQPAAAVARRSVVPAVMVSPFQDATEAEGLGEDRQQEGLPLLPGQPPQQQQLQRRPSGLPRVPSHDSLNAGLQQRSASLKALQELTAAGPEPAEAGQEPRGGIPSPMREARQHTVHWSLPHVPSDLTVRKSTSWSAVHGCEQSVQ